MRGELLLLLSDGLAILCITRFLLLQAGLDSRDPLLGFAMQATDWLVQPLHKIIPARGQKDRASIAAVAILYYLVFTAIALVAGTGGFGGRMIAANLLFALLHLFKSVLYVFLLGLVIRLIVSMRAPYSLLLAALEQIYRPLLKPFGFLRVGRYDFSGSLFALILWYLLSTLLPGIVRQINLWLLNG